MNLRAPDNRRLKELKAKFIANANENQKLNNDYQIQRRKLLEQRNTIEDEIYYIKYGIKVGDHVRGGTAYYEEIENGTYEHKDSKNKDYIITSIVYGDDINRKPRLLCYEVGCEEHIYNIYDHWFKV